MLSYCGIPLSEPGASELAGYIESVHRPEEIFPLAALWWPGTLTGGPILQQTNPPWRPVRVGRLFWPWGASRFAQGHFVVSESQLAAIRSATTVGGVYRTGLFTCDDATRSVTAYLWMLPARPLATAVAGAGMYLLTLVDDRYFWWDRSLLLSVTPGTTTWAGLYSAIGAAIGVGIDSDPIPSAYGTPTIDYAAHYRPPPLVLDAVAFSVGQRITRSYAGAVTAQNYSTARASTTAMLAQPWARYAGGNFALDGRR